MLEILRINTIIGLILAIIVYGMVMFALGREQTVLFFKERGAFTAFCNTELKQMYGFKTDKSTLVCVLIWIVALIEAIFVWELHWPVVVWLICKEIKDEANKLD